VKGADMVFLSMAAMGMLCRCRTFWDAAIFVGKKEGKDYE